MSRQHTDDENKENARVRSDRTAGRTTGRGTGAGLRANKKASGNKWILPLAVYLGLLAVCVILIYVIPSVRGLMVKTYIAEQGDITLQNEVTGCIIRTEKVYTAENSYKVTRLIDEGTLVKAYSRIVKLEDAENGSESRQYASILSELGDSVNVTDSGTNAVAGYVCYSVDGSESRLNKSAAAELSKTELDELSGVSPVKTAKGNCAAGDPLYKIVKQTKWNIVFFLDNDAASKYYEGKDVTVSIEDYELRAEVASMNQGKKETRIVLSLGMFYPGFLTDRKVDMTVTTANASGLKVLDSSIVEKDGKKGVLVKNKMGKYIFKPICVKADDGERCVVYQDIYMDEEFNYVATLGIYDEIVSAPTEEDIAAAE